MTEILNNNIKVIVFVCQLHATKRADQFAKLLILFMSYSLLKLQLFITKKVTARHVIKSHFNFDTCRPCYAKSIFYDFRGTNYYFSTFHGRYSCRS